MNRLPSSTAVYSGRPARFATPTRQCTTFSAADAELAAITADCVSHEHAFVRRQCHNSSGGSPISSPVQAHEAARPQRRMRDTQSPSTPLRDCAGRIPPVSPRRRRCTGPSFADVDALCGSPRIHLAVPTASLRHPGRDASQLSEWGCSQRMQDSLTDLLAVRAGVSARESCSASELKTTTPSLSATPLEHARSLASPRCNLLPTSLDFLTAEEATSANKSIRPLSSPSFSFFSNVGERRSSRTTTAVDSASSAEGRHFVSPRSFALRPPPAQWGDVAAASLSSSTLPTEVKVFSPLRFDAHAAPSTHSQGLSSISPSQFSSVPPLVAHHSLSQYPSEEERENTAADDAGFATCEEVCDVVRQQRLLYACVLSIAREKRELASELQRLRRRRLTVLVRLVLDVMFRLPVRVLTQFFFVCVRKLRGCATHDQVPVSLLH